MLKIKYYQATVWEVSKNDLPMKSTFASKALLSQFNNYELSMMTLKG